MAEQWLGMVQGAGGEAAHAVLGQAAGRAEQRVPVLGCAVSTGDGSARGPDQGQGHNSVYDVLWEGTGSEGPPGRRKAVTLELCSSLWARVRVGQGTGEKCTEHLAVCSRGTPHAVLTGSCSQWHTQSGTSPERVVAKGTQSLGQNCLHSVWLSHR